ncbi:response regulator transcription factor [Longispora albida]|uniref:response regulator transcription factor n=1 Tax=Longispora albida TaxID=203523 RepID=UPI000475C581|nr:response regulator transcription factor [Longispora albida]
MSRVPVYLHAADPISHAGVAGQLRHRSEIQILADDELERAAVAVMVVDTVDEEALRLLRSLRCAGVHQLVVVARQLADADLVALVEVGVGGLIRRSEATPDRLVSVILSAAAGEGVIPPDLLGRLLSQVGQVQRHVLGPRGLTFSGLAEREIQVLKLVADGLDTAEIALKLSYSQRTVKNVLHDITSRLHLRNRSHAVAYALRHGLI